MVHYSCDGVVSFFPNLLQIVLLPNFARPFQALQISCFGNVQLKETPKLIM